MWKTEPARALRPAAPGAVRNSFLEKIPGVVKILTIPGLMGLRSLARNSQENLFFPGGHGSRVYDYGDSRIYECVV